jgi:hypothetical protein
MKLNLIEASKLATSGDNLTLAQKHLFLELGAELDGAAHGAELWRRECIAMGKELAKLAELPMDPYPGWMNCSEKIRNTIDRLHKTEAELRQDIEGLRADVIEKSNINQKLAETVNELRKTEAELRQEIVAVTDINEDFNL